MGIYGFGMIAFEEVVSVDNLEEVVSVDNNEVGASYATLR